MLPELHHPSVKCDFLFHRDKIYICRGCHHSKESKIYRGQYKVNASSNIRQILFQMFHLDNNPPTPLQLYLNLVTEYFP